MAGAPDAVMGLVTREVEQGLRKRFAQVAETKERAGASVASGREYVAAYVEYIHYAEGFVQAAAGPSGHAAHDAEATPHVH